MLKRLQNLLYFLNEEILHHFQQKKKRTHWEGFQKRRVSQQGVQKTENEASISQINNQNIQKVRENILQKKRNLQKTKQQKGGIIGNGPSKWGFVHKRGEKGGKIGKRRSIIKRITEPKLSERGISGSSKFLQDLSKYGGIRSAILNLYVPEPGNKLLLLLTYIMPKPRTFQ